MSKFFFIFFFICLFLFYSCEAQQKICPSGTFPRVSCGKFNTSVECDSVGCCFDDEAAVKCAFPLLSPSSSCPLWKQGEIFDQQEINKMYRRYIENIDINKKGAVCASRDNNTAIGSYYYHWSRDAALVMKYFMQLNDFSLSKIESAMSSYIYNWVLPIEHSKKYEKIDPRVEPKFNIESGTPYTGPWCKPQADATGLRATTLSLYANVLYTSGRKDEVINKIYPAIKFDLDWITEHWKEETCDVWEDARSKEFFWVKMAFWRGLIEGSKISSLVGDSSSKEKYTKLKKEIQESILTHYDKNAEMLTEEKEIRQIDGATLLAYIENYVDDGFINPLDPMLANTIHKISKIFCELYPVNFADSDNGIPGVLHGRYIADNYCGGNPWHITTGGVARVFYLASLEAIKKYKEGIYTVEEGVLNAWKKVIDKDNIKDTNYITLAKSLLTSGDALLSRMRQHALKDDMHLYEQIGAHDGKQVNAKDLTWSLGVALTAMKMRGKVISEIENIETTI